MVRRLTPMCCSQPEGASLPLPGTAPSSPSPLGEGWLFGNMPTQVSRKEITLPAEHHFSSMAGVGSRGGTSPLCLGWAPTHPSVWLLSDHSCYHLPVHSDATLVPESHPFIRACESSPTHTHTPHCFSLTSSTPEVGMSHQLDPHPRPSTALHGSQGGRNRRQIVSPLPRHRGGGDYTASHLLSICRIPQPTLLHRLLAQRVAVSWG